MSAANLIALAGQDNKKGVITLETSMMVFGMIAVHFSDTGKAGIRGWAQSERKGSMVIGTDRWTCGRIPSEKVPEALAAFGVAKDGFLVSKLVDVMNGGKSAEHYWVLAEGLVRVVAEMVGVKVRL